jgi:hypothetical protein
MKHHNSSHFAPQDAVAAVSSSLYDFSDLDAASTLTPTFFSSDEDGLDLPSFFGSGMGPPALGLLHATPNAPPSPSGLGEWLLQPVSKSPSQSRDAVLKHSSKSDNLRSCGAYPVFIPIISPAYDHERQS